MGRRAARERGKRGWWQELGIAVVVGSASPIGFLKHNLTHKMENGSKENFMVRCTKVRFLTLGFIYLIVTFDLQSTNKEEKNFLSISCWRLFILSITKQNCIYIDFWRLII